MIVLLRAFGIKNPLVYDYRTLLLSHVTILLTLARDLLFTSLIRQIFIFFLTKKRNKKVKLSVKS